MNSPLQLILDTVAEQAVEGKTTKELDDLAASLISLHGCKPAFLGYQPKNAPTPYPNVMCVSINNEVIHGIPGSRKIEWGDVVKLDLGLIMPDGQYDDLATTVGVNASAVARRLIKTTKEALEAGVAAAKAGNTTHDIAKAVSAVAHREGFGVIKKFGGHGIGTELHMEPQIPNEVEGEPVKLETGMRICIEPMFSSRRGDTVVAKDGWTIKLAGGGVVAHFERSLTIQ